MAEQLPGYQDTVLDIPCPACSRTIFIPGVTVPLRTDSLQRERIACPHCGVQIGADVRKSFKPTVPYEEMRVITDNAMRNKARLSSYIPTSTWSTTVWTKRRRADGVVEIEHLLSLLDFIGAAFLTVLLLSVLINTANLAGSVGPGVLLTKVGAYGGFLAALVSVYWLHLSEKSFRETEIQPEYDKVAIIGAAAVVSVLAVFLAYHAWSILIYCNTPGGIAAYFDFYNY